MEGRACPSRSELCQTEMGLAGSPSVHPVPKSVLGDVSTSSAPSSGGGPLQSGSEGDVSDKVCLWRVHCSEGWGPLWVLVPLTGSGS